MQLRTKFFSNTPRLPLGSVAIFVPGPAALSYNFNSEVFAATTSLPAAPDAGRALGAASYYDATIFSAVSSGTVRYGFAARSMTYSTALQIFHGAQCVGNNVLAIMGASPTSPYTSNKYVYASAATSTGPVMPWTAGSSNNNNKGQAMGNLTVALLPRYNFSTSIARYVYSSDTAVLSSISIGGGPRAGACLSTATFGIIKTDMSALGTIKCIFASDTQTAGANLPALPPNSSNGAEAAGAAGNDAYGLFMSSTGANTPMIGSKYVYSSEVTSVGSSISASSLTSATGSNGITGVNA